MQGIFDPLSDAQDLFLATQFSQLQQHLRRKNKPVLNTFHETKRLGLLSPFKSLLLQGIGQLGKDDKCKTSHSENSSEFQIGETIQLESSQEPPNGRYMSAYVQRNAGNYEQHIHGYLYLLDKCFI